MIEVREARFHYPAGDFELRIPELEVETGAGLRRIWPTLSGGRMLSGRIAMGEPIFAARHIPVVALSANAMAGDVEKGQSAGFSKYLTKPVKVNELIVTIRDALGEDA